MDVGIIQEAKMRDVLRAQEWYTVKGKSHQVDLQLGDCQLDYDIRSNRDMDVFISFGDKVIPIGSGQRVNGRLIVADIRWMLITCDKEATIACSIFQHERRIVDKLSNKPLAVFVPEAPTVDLRSMVDRLVGERLEEQLGPGEAEISLEEFFDDDVADGEEEFGRGFMEVDELTAEAFERRAIDERERRAAAAEPAPARKKEPKPSSGRGSGRRAARRDREPDGEGDTKVEDEDGLSDA